MATCNEIVFAALLDKHFNLTLETAAPELKAALDEAFNAGADMDVYLKLLNHFQVKK